MTPAATLVAVRSSVATAETVGFAVLAHTYAGGGQIPAPAQVAALAAVVFAAACATLSGRMRLRVVAPFIAATQLGLHLVFSRFPGTPVPSSGGPHLMDAAHGQMMPMGAGGSSAPFVHALDLRMLVAHAVITLVAVLVLMVQERALGALAALVSSTTLTCAPIVRSLRTLRSALRVGGRQAVQLSAATRRGPPALAC